MTAILMSDKNWLVTAEHAASLQPTTLIAGKDPGAGYGKGCYADMSITLPSAYSLVRNRSSAKHHETISKDGAWIRYVEGTRRDLANTQFFWGSAAIAQPDHLLLHDDKGKKGELALESILADLAILNIPSGSGVQIALSSHNPEKWGDEIKRRVSGVHTYQHKHPVSREIVDKTVEIEVGVVYPEGYGAIAYSLFGGGGVELEPSDTAISLDIGSSTWIVTVFDGAGSVVDRYLIDGGVGELCGAIALQLDNLKDGVSLMTRDTKHSPAVVNRGIIDKSFIYGSNAMTGKPFQPIYASCLDRWWSAKIEQVATFLTNRGHLDRARMLLAFGGGSQLPVVDENLANLGFTVLQNGQFINALGLQLLAEISNENK